LSSKTSTSGRRPGGSDRASEAGDARRNRVAWLTNDSRGVSDWPARYELLSDDRRTLGRRHRAPARAHRGRPAYCCPLSVHRRPGPVPGRRDQRGETRPEMDQRLLGGGLLLHRRLASRAGGGPPGDPGRTGGPPAVARRRSGRMMGHWQLAAVMAPSAALARGISLGRLRLARGRGRGRGHHGRPGQLVARSPARASRAERALVVSLGGPVPDAPVAVPGPGDVPVAASGPGNGVLRLTAGVAFATLRGSGRVDGYD